MLKPTPEELATYLTALASVIRLTGFDLHDCALLVTYVGSDTHTSDPLLTEEDRSLARVILSTYRESFTNLPDSDITGLAVHMYARLASVRAFL